MQSPDKKIVEYTMELGRVHLIVFFMILPVLLLYLLPFFLVWDMQTFRTGWEQFYNMMVPVFLAGVVIHEFLHGFTWSFFIPGGMKSVRFGIHWKFLAPYCHCKVPMKTLHYGIGSAMPLIVMGILPGITAILIGSSSLLLFGIMFTWVAGGDIISLLMLLKARNNNYVFDHPEKPGFYIITGIKQ